MAPTLKIPCNKALIYLTATRCTKVTNKMDSPFKCDVSLNNTVHPLAPANV